MDLSIIIINKNYQQYLKKSIYSCINQKTKYSFEIIIIDDGSRDKSLQLANSIKNKNLKIFSVNNFGVEKASNLGFKKSKGKFVLRVDSDDYLHKNFIQIMLNKIIGTKYSFVYPNYNLISKSGKLIRKISLPNFNKKEILERGDFLATGTIFRKREIKLLGYYNESHKNCGLENYELIIKLLKKNKKGNHINKFLFSYRRHYKNLSLVKQKKIKYYGINLFKKMKIGKYQKNNFNPTY